MNIDKGETLDLDDIVANAQLAYDEGAFLDAANSFLQAAETYTLIGDESSAAEMANNCSVSYLRGGEPQLAFNVIQGKETIFEKLGDHHRLAMTLGNCGAALEDLDNIDEALEYYRLSADLFNQIGEQDLYISTIQAISTLLLRNGKPVDALATMQLGINKIQNPNLQQRLLKKLFNIPFQLMNH